jgi:hypothetical protein
MADGPTEPFVLDILSSEEDQGDLKAGITAILNENNEKLGFKWRPQPLVLYVKDASGAVLAGLTGSTNWGWLHVDLLAVQAPWRGTGVGARLLARAEEMALERGCRHAYLDTFSFQALGFYEKQGYAVYGQLENFPTGASRYFLKKTL